MNYQWYPGHMTKARRMMQENIKLIDLVIELVDARIPISSRNPDIDELGKGKSRIILLNKSDLADPVWNKKWVEYFAAKGMGVLEINSRTGMGIKSIQGLVQEVCKEKIERDRKRGIVNRPVRAMVVGIPNVGKSTFLSRVSNARPKIANYHFTTLNPNLGVVDLDGGDGFVIADIPGLIEGASEGIGLGHEFLRHVERTKVMIHMVDAASTEGRDPIEDIKVINAELASYNEELASRPQVIAANKIDVFYGNEGEEVLQALKDEFEPKGIKVFPISAVSGKGVKELLYYVKERLNEIGDEPVVFEKEFFVDSLEIADEPYTVEVDEDGMYVVEGPRIEKMLGYTNLDSEKGFEFFQKFLKENGILEQLEALGIEDGDTVRMYGLQFDYYK